MYKKCLFIYVLCVTCVGVCISKSHQESVLSSSRKETRADRGAVIRQRNVHDKLVLSVYRMREKVNKTVSRMVASDDWRDLDRMIEKGCRLCEALHGSSEAKTICASMVRELLILKRVNSIVQEWEEEKLRSLAAAKILAKLAL